MADEPRRVRTQAERDADGTTWRATADSRPGYATYRVTAPGSPSWWLRYGEPEIHQHAPTRPPHLGPAPVDGETCVKWCGFCHLGPQPAVIDETHTLSAEVVDQLAAISERVVARNPGSFASATTADPGIWMTAEPIVPPRRRWWHRLTRRPR